MTWQTIETLTAASMGDQMVMDLDFAAANFGGPNSVYINNGFGFDQGLV